MSEKRLPIGLIRQWKMAEDVPDLCDEIDGLRSRVEVLEEALKPFAELKCFIDNQDHSNDFLLEPENDLIEEVRNARRLLGMEVEP